MSTLSTLQITNNSTEHFSKNILPLKHLQIRQIQHSVVFREASHTYIKIFSERIQVFSIQDVYRMLIEENHLGVTDEQVPSLVKSSAAFVIDLANLDCIDNIKSNYGESMTHDEGQVLKQVYRGECDNFAIRQRLAEEVHEEGFIYV